MRAATESLWAEVSKCFDEDDGSLPSIEIAKLSPAGVSAIYSMLRQRSQLEGAEPPEFWSRVQGKSVPVDSVPDAAAEVVAGNAEPFHHCISGVVAAGVELPVLGVFVWDNAVELDYRMGPDWGPAQVSGFFELLRDCCALDPAAEVVPASAEGPPYPERFARAWAFYYGKYV